MYFVSIESKINNTFIYCITRSSIYYCTLEENNKNITGFPVLVSKEDVASRSPMYFYFILNNSNSNRFQSQEKILYLTGNQLRTHNTNFFLKEVN